MSKTSNDLKTKSAKSKKSLRPQSQRLVLEPRIVFDAVLPIMGAEVIEHTSEHLAEQPAEHSALPEAPYFEAPAVATNTNEETHSIALDSVTEVGERPLIEGTLAPANLNATEIIFIDAIVADLQQYITDHPNADVVLLDSSKDALDQIAAVLNGRTDISAIHILSHGTSGELQIGNGVLNIQNLLSAAHAEDLSIISQALTQDADILIYGCNVAEGSKGQTFVNALAAATGADIAASTNTTGAAEAFGGDWQLETQTAAIETDSLQLQDWQGQLVYSNTFTGGAWTFNAAANTATVPVTATNTTDGVTTTVTLGGPANAWSATAVQTLNNIAAFANGAQNTADFTSTFNTANTAGLTGTVTITFSKPVLNPIIHIDRIGGSSGGLSNSSLWTLTTAGATLTKLNGTSSLLVGGASANGSTGTTIQRQTGLTTAGTESSLTSANGSAAGSIQVAGTYTTLTFNVTGAADGLELAFAFDAPPTTNNDAFTINEDTTLTGNLFANNGSGADAAYGDAVVINTINGAAFTVGTPIALTNGSLTITNATTGAFTFTPNANFTGTQAFTYNVIEVNTSGLAAPGNNTGVGNISNTSTATITIIADTDGDGITNTNDLDDDNDGILDTVENESNVVAQSFGSGTGRFSFATAGLTATTTYTYNGTGQVQDGQYSLVSAIDASQGGWWANPIFNDANSANQNTTFRDHTGDLNGRFLMVNAAFAVGEFYRDSVTLTQTGSYSLSAFLANANNFSIKPNVTLSMLDSGGAVVASINSGDLPSFTTPAAAWQQYGLTTNLTAGNYTLVLINNAPGGGGNDLFIDDITLLFNSADTDGDGIINSLDLDSDNDGISDLSESTGGTGDALADTNNDGTISLAESIAAGATGDGDIDNDGLMDIFDANTASILGTTSLGNTPINSDGDTRANYLDLDSDNDGIADTVEARLTAGYVANDGNVANNDVDKDGIIDIFDSNDGTTKLFGGSFVYPVNTDGADLVDYLDTDSDNDGKLDRGESGLSTVTTDANGDGIRDSVSASYADPDGLVNNPQVNLANEVGTTAQVAYREVNTAPIIDLNSAATLADTVRTNVATYVENATSVNVATGTAGTNDNGNADVSSMTIGLSGVVNGANEVISIGGLSFPSNANSTQTATIGGTLFSIAYSTVTGFTITKSGGGTMPTADMDTLIRGITYAHTSENPTTGARLLTFTLIDAVGLISPPAVATVNVTPVNDAPVGTNKTVTIIEDTPSYTVTAADFGFTDVDSNAFANVIVTSRPPAADGVYRLNGVAITTGQVITVADINAGNLTFSPTLNKNGTTIGALGFKVQDNGGVANGGVDTDPVAKTLDFNITAVNDAPTVTLPATGVLTTVEDTPLILNAITLADVDATTGSESVTITIGAGQGVLNWTATPFVSVTNNGTGSITLAGQINAIRNAITTGNALSYAPTADFNGTATLTVTINDNGNTGTGGALSATATTNITVTPVVDVVNDAVTTSEDTPITFNVLTNLPANGASADNFENVAAAVTATSTPANGTVTFSANGSLVYTPNANYSGSDTFTYTVTSGGVTETATVTVTINSVNDAPAGTDKTISTAEDTAVSLSVADFGFTDPNDTTANAFANVIITSLPTTGTFTLSGIAVTAGQIVTVANIPNLTWTPATNANGTAVSSFTFQVQDNGATGGLNQNTDQSANTITFNVNPVNDAPINTVPATQTTLEDTPKTITGLSINDVDAATGSITVTLTITNGTLTVTGGTATIAGTGTTTVTLTGTQAQINATLASSVSYVPTSNFNGSSTLTLVTNDNGNTGSGGALSDTDTVTINVTSVNDAPTGANLTGAATEDTPYTVTAANFGFADANDTPANAFANVIISGALPPAIQGVYQLNGIAITNGQVISVADINAGLLKFVPAPNFNGNTVAALIFKVQDNGGTANTGVDTSVAPNTFTLNIVPMDDLVTFSNLTNGTVAGTDAQVKESDLATGSTPTGTAETATGTFNVGPDASLAATGTALSINGTNITKAQLAAATAGAPITVAGSNGTLSITAYNATTGAVTYAYTLTSAANHTGNITVNDSFALIATDVEGQTSTGTLAINILDDAPVAVADVDEVINLGGNPSSTASGNVVKGIGGTDPNSADGNKDAIGADANASPVTGVVAGTGAPVGANVGNAVISALGSLTLNANGSYVYTPDYAEPAVRDLAAGATLSDVFTYQVTDSDGDVVSTTLTITIVGVPAIIGLNDGSVAGTDGSVLESDLSAGTNAVGTGETLAGTFELASPTFGVNSLTIAGTIIYTTDLENSADTPITITTANGTLLINGYTQGAAPSGTVILPGSISGGTVNYTYTLITPPTSAAAVTDDFQVAMIDGANNNTAAGPAKFLKIAIIDDAPIATADVASVTESGNAVAGTPTATGNVVTDLTTGDIMGADGASTTPVGPVTGLVAGAGAPISGVGVGSAVTGSYGSVNIAADGTYTYTLDNNNTTVNALKSGQTLTETYTYQITDKDGDTATTTLTITINGANDAPIAVDDGTNLVPLPIVEDTPTVLNLLGNDTDPEGDTLSIKSINGQTITAGVAASIPVPNGTVNVSSGGVITFTPNLNYNGQITFDYVVTDGLLDDTGTVNLNVTPVNDAPVAANDGPVVTAPNTPASGTVLANDTDADGDTLTVTQFVINGTTYPAGSTATIAGVGTLVINADGTYTFTPVAAYDGPVPTATYTISDGTTTASADLSFAAVPNTAPVAVADIVNSPEDTPVNASVLTNDSDAEVDTLTVTQFTVVGLAGTFTAGSTATIPGVGSLVINSDGSYTFTPSLNFNGLVPQATVTVSDGTATSTSPLDITVTPGNDTPVAAPDLASTPEDTPVSGNVLTNDSDVDTGTTLAVTQFVVNGTTYPAGTTATITGVSTLVINADGSYTFTPALDFNGAMPQATYTVSDGSGTANSTTTSTLDVNVSAVNDPPVATDDTILATEDTPIVLTLVGNDIDVDGNTLTVKSINGFDLTPGVAQLIAVPNGVVSVSATSVITFTPAPNYNGPVAFNYEVQDGNGGIDTGAVTLNIAPVNDLPVATPITATGNEDTPIAINLTGTDIEGPIGSVIVTSLPPASEGILTLADGTPITAGQVLTPAQAASLIFTPAANFFGTVNITFTVTDNDGATSAPSTTVITVNDLVSPPTANPLNISGAASDVIALPLGGVDADGVIASVTIKALPPLSQGVLTLADGTPVAAGQVLTPAQAAGLVFKPSAGFTGTATILFTVTDDEGLESPIAGANISLVAKPLIPEGGLFEQLVSDPIKFNDRGINPDVFAFRSPVIPIGMPEDIFVIHSVRESAMRIGQNSNFGVFNVDVPTRGELDNLTFDLKGLPVGMDPTLFVQHAVRSLPITQEPRLFVQNAVRQSQLESTMRNVGVSSFNTATNGVSSLFSPFDLGSPNDLVDLSIDGLQGEFKRAVINAPDRVVSQENVQDSLIPGQEEVVILSDNLVAEKLVSAKHTPQKEIVPQKIAAASFANQLSASAKKMKSNPFLTNN